MIRVRRIKQRTPLRSQLEELLAEASKMFDSLLFSTPADDDS